jgi:hypothetical protein
VCGRASESTIIGLIIPESARGIVTTFDICRFQDVTALALTTLWKPWGFPVVFQLLRRQFAFYCSWRQQRCRCRVCLIDAARLNIQYITFRVSEGKYTSDTSENVSNTEEHSGAELRIIGYAKKECFQSVPKSS